MLAMHMVAKLMISRENILVVIYSHLAITIYIASRLDSQPFEPATDHTEYFSFFMGPAPIVILWLHGIAMATPFLCLYSNALMLLYKSAKK